ncbi:hypothetical protein K2Z83_08235 [Oscillochloris sp. ZM17-4]|uniref:hypothetical protein n=1 Tax=Oscillochloris sp. ZM17-4 TaxID=2866714 RepID=UPI001C734159|nr:hypothetical protein [Oscillochloris sp. ZM17-4]MBX0327664.1 hypothetical protein [Oscillochloris sp. ZM17-4]
MNTFALLRLGLIALICMAVGQIVFASAAANTIAPTNLGSMSHTVRVYDLAPAACGGLTPSHLVTGSGTITGTSGDDLILGGDGDDLIDGLGGDDCILGGGGDDTLVGGEGDDVCIGGPGTDIIDPTCE